MGDSGEYGGGPTRAQTDGAGRRRTRGWLGLALLLLAGFSSPGRLSAGLPSAAAGAEPPPPEPAYVVFLPVMLDDVNGFCPAQSAAHFDRLSVIHPSTARPPGENPDLNLSVRGFEPTVAPLQLVDYRGGFDPQAPQMIGIFSDGRMPRLTGAFRVYDWDWSCREGGCRGALLDRYPVTLLALGTVPGEPLSIPGREPPIDAGGQKALVLYAEERRITLVYLREDTVAVGYTVHLENLCVDPNLLALYRRLHEAGRRELPALTNHEPLGIAVGSQVLVAIRDSGTFMDPRSRKDWWQGR